MPEPPGAKLPPEDGLLAKFADTPTEATNTTTSSDTHATAWPQNTAHSDENLNVVPAESGQNLFLQLGLFASRENAESFRDRVTARIGDLAGQIELKAEGGYFRLLAGPYASLGTARAVAERLGKLLDIQAFTIWRSQP
ncbi:MAG: SPOR domain-containing protein [Azoarcus sp.]|nr:SPOR domain-containing protein [Azoarcus sp.]